MPRFEPVDHDPFAAPRVAFMPVDNDPFMTSPEDAFAYGKGISPDATWRNLLPAAELGLGLAPGSGEAMSARDAWDASGRAGAALTEGNLGEAASEYLNMGTGLLGAIPGAGIIARGTKRGAAWMDRNLPEGFNRFMDSVYPADPRSTSFSGVGPAPAANVSNVTEKFDEDALTKIANTFGTTREFSEAGYILPNGRFLDYSGFGADRAVVDNFPYYKSRGGIEPSPGSVLFDHRDIIGVDPAFSTGNKADWTRLASRTGMARIDPNGEGIEFFSIPTQSQLKTILRAIQKGEMSPQPYIGVTDPETGGNIISEQFDRINLEQLNEFVNRAKNAWQR